MTPETAAAHATGFDSYSITISGIALHFTIFSHVVTTAAHNLLRVAINVMAEGLVLLLFVEEIPPDAGLGCHASSTGLVQTTASTSLCSCPLGTGLLRRRLHNHIALWPFLQNCRTRSDRVLSGSRDRCESESAQVCLLTLSCCLAAAVAAACTPEVSLVARSTSSAQCQTHVVVKTACGVCSLPLR